MEFDNDCIAVPDGFETAALAAGRCFFEAADEDVETGVVSLMEDVNSRIVSDDSMQHPPEYMPYPADSVCLRALALVSGSDEWHEYEDLVLVQGYRVITE